MTNEQCPMTNDRGSNRWRRALSALVIGTWSFTGHWSLVIGHSAQYSVAGPPSIASQPQSRTNPASTDAIFGVTAAGTAPLFYQWYFNGTNALRDMTNSSLTIVSAQVTNMGSYDVVVSNSSGSVTSQVAALVVQLYDYGDAPSGYPTLLAEDGARHVV